MKEFVEVDLYGAGTEQDPIRPNFNGEETKEGVSYSVMDKGDGTAVVRVTTETEALHTTITGLANVTVLNDSTAESKIKSLHPAANLENLDQPDKEMDAMMNAHAIQDVLLQEEIDQLLESDRNPWETVDDITDTATACRALVQSPTVGRQTLQDQELTLNNLLAKAEGRPNADELPRTTTAPNAGDMGPTEMSILMGENAAQADMREYAKGNKGKPWDGGETPPGNGNPQNQ